MSVDPEGLFTHGGRNHACPPWPSDKRARWPPYALFCSDYVVEALIPYRGHLARGNSPRTFHGPHDGALYL